MRLQLLVSRRSECRHSCLLACVFSSSPPESRRLQALYASPENPRAGAAVGTQGNVDPMMLFAPPDVLRAEVVRCCRRAGRRGHILNVGHGVVQVRAHVLDSQVHLLT